MIGRRFAWLGFAGLAATLSACQLVSGLSGYRESGSASGAAGTGGSTSSSTGTSATSGGGGCLLGSAMCRGDFMGGPYGAVTAIAAKPSAPGAFWVASSIMGDQIEGINSDGHQVGPLLVSASIKGLTSLDGKQVFFTRDGAMESGLYTWDGADGDKAVISAVNPITTSVGAVMSIEPGLVAWGVRDGKDAWSVTTATNDLKIPSVNPTVGPPLFAADDKNIYWLDMPSQFIQADPDGTVKPVMVTSILSPIYLAADGDAGANGYLYWISATNQLVRVHKNTLTPQTIDSLTTVNITVAKGLVVSSQGDVYWLDDPGPSCASASGKLMGLYKNGTPASGLPTGLACPSNLAQDNNYLYYSAGAPGATQVFRVPIPPP